MSDVNINSYFKSIKRDFVGALAEEKISEIARINQGLVIIPDKDTFYAKGFFDEKLTDKFYFFNQSRLRIVGLDLAEDRIRVENVTIREYKYTQIKNLSLKLNSKYEIALSFNIDNQAIELNNSKDSNGTWIESLGKQIREIYNLINKG